MFDWRCLLTCRMKCPLLEVSPMFLQRRTSLRYRSISKFESNHKTVNIYIYIYIYLRKCKFNPSFNEIKNFCLWIPSSNSSPVRARNAWSSEFTKIKVSKQKIISYICWFVQIYFVLVKKFISSEKIWAAEVESNVFRKVSRPSEIVYL